MSVKIRKRIKKILMINASSTKHIYEGTNVGQATFRQPNLTLATLAAPLVENGFNVKILDMDLPNKTDEDLIKTLFDYSPDLVCFTAVTPIIYEVERLAKLVKENSPLAITVIGGVHATMFSEELARKYYFDFVAVGEADFTLLDIAKGVPRNKIKGILFKNKSGLMQTQSRERLADLDQLPYPRWDLFDLNCYKGSYLSVKKDPCGTIETSRGCLFGCVYCNKCIFGRNFRAKSVDRVVSEFRYMIQCGFNEIHIIDDGFSTDLERAKQICREIIRQRIKIHWSLYNGIRVDRCDDELFKLLKKAGCYQVAFGIESGDNEVLKRIKKGTDTERIRFAVKLAKKNHLATFGFFMLGLPGESETSLRKTINFAKELNLDLAKFDITIPYPGTELYNEWKKEGLIKSTDWKKYVVHDPNSRIFDHPSLPWKVIEAYYKRAYREYYLRPKYILYRFYKSLISLQLYNDLKSFVQTKW